MRRGNAAFTLLLDKPIAETEAKLKRFRSHSINLYVDQ